MAEPSTEEDPDVPEAQIQMPDGWEAKIDESCRVFYVDHFNKTTTRIDPRDKFTKPGTFADCVANELPYGWEIAMDKTRSTYFINHKEATTQIEDPRHQWRAMQDKMIKEYLASATGSLQAKQQILSVKKQRLELAENEYLQLNQTLAAYQDRQQRKLAKLGHQQQKLGQQVTRSHVQLSPCASEQQCRPSTSFASSSSSSSSKPASLASSTSSLYTRYDPELLRQEIEMSKKRVSQLKQEQSAKRQELNYKTQGCETLAQIEQKLATTPVEYSPNEARQLAEELNLVQQSLKAGEAEKKQLVKSLMRLKDEIQRVSGTKTPGAQASPDISMMALDTASIASQTDLSVPPPSGIRIQELAKSRLKFDETRKTLHSLQAQLADLEEQMNPPQLDLDKAQLDLLWEKEQLLRELKAVSLAEQHKDHRKMVQ